MMAVIENSVLLKQFNTNPASMDIINISFFSKLDQLKSANNLLERNGIVSTMCRYDLSTLKFSEQKKNVDVQLSDVERIIYESFCNAFSKSEEDYIAICDFYMNEVSCLKIENDVKDNFINRIGFLRDLLIYVDYETYKKKTSSDVILKIAKPYGYCFEDCFDKELEAIRESVVKTIFFLLHTPFSSAELAIVCAVECL